MMHTFQCPVCAFAGMDEPPISHAICACCGTHFEYDDVVRTHFDLRNAWLMLGGHWFDTEDPSYMTSAIWGGINWNAWDQLDYADFRYAVPRPAPDAALNAFMPTLHVTDLFRQTYDSRAYSEEYLVSYA